MFLPPEGSDVPRIIHLKKVWKQTGKKPKELEDRLQLPEEGEYIWEWFLEIIGGGEVTWESLRAWAGLKGIKLSSKETELLFSLNRLYASAQHGRRHNKTGS